MDVVRQVGAILLVFGLLGIAVWRLRGGSICRLGNWGAALRNRRPGDLESAGRLMLTPQHTIHLVRVHGREWMVATHPQGCSLLADFSGSSSSKPPELGRGADA